MVDPGEPAPDLVQHVRSALAHLYDPAFLQNHELVAYLRTDVRTDGVTRAQMLRRLLLDSIEMLKPAVQADAPPESTRAYAILTYRYVDGLAVEEISERLNLSQRQIYREHAKGLRAVASLLEQQEGFGLQAAAPAAAPPAEGSEQPDRLALAKAEIDRLGHHVSADVLDVSHVLREICDLLRPRQEQSGVAIAVVSPLPWPHIVADRSMLRQALLSLLSHALDVVQHGVVEIAARPLAGGLLLQISEPAEGVRPQAGAPEQRAGVGLAVAKELIAMQGGRMTVEEEPERWRAELYFATRSTRTVLVIDDNADLIQLFKRYAGGHRVAIVGAANEENLVDKASDLCPQLIILDLMMPHVDGWEILQALKAHAATRTIPVVICSVLNETQLAMAMGASDYLTKPVSQTAFLEMLRRWLGALPSVG